MPWEALDHDADVMLEIEGGTFADLLAEAARAVCAVVGDAPAGGEASGYGAVLEGETPADLLHLWLSEVLFQLQTHRIYFLSAAWKDASDSPPRLMANVTGVLLPAGWEGRLEVKAVTYHGLEVVRRPLAYAATVILDV